MENIYIFLIALAVMGIKAILSKKGDEPEEASQPDLSDMEMPELHYPEPQPEAAPQPPLYEPPILYKPRQQTKRCSTYSPLPEEGVRSTYASQASSRLSQPPRVAAPATGSPLPTPPEAGCEFADPSAEELRRAVIWSEILQRKY